jgi:3',5'-cyclic AMP phosphodiesterase CpdA
LEFRLAHLSDPHLGPIPKGTVFKDFKLKRLIGVISWKVRRHRLFQRHIAEAVRDDLKAHAPDHCAFTGDAINVSAVGEFGPAREWLESIGSAGEISFVPGNHDAYVEIPYAIGMSHFEPYMLGDMRFDGACMHMGGATAFPYVRLRRNIALIGLSSALPQSLFKATGSLGHEQIQALPELLKDLKSRGFCRVVMIHHPPMPGITDRRRALLDDGELSRVLAEKGAELVIFGHNHRRSLHYIEAKTGKVPLVGAPAASMVDDGRHNPGGWNLYTIDRDKGTWQIQVTERSWDGLTGGVVTTGEYFV